MNLHNNFSHAIGLLLMSIVGSSMASETIDDRVEVNLTIDGERWGIASRHYLNLDEDQIILRYKIDDTWSSQYRYVSKDSGDRIEHRLRIQHKTFRSGGWFLNTRVEHRAKEQAEDILRIRPQMGYKYSMDSPVTLYYKFEPHWEYQYENKELGFKFTQHFLGFDYVVSENWTAGLFLEIDTDVNWEKELGFFGIQLSAKLR